MEIPIPISIIFDTLLKTNVEDDQHPFEKRTKIFPTSILWFHLGFRTSTTCNEHCDVVQKKPQVHAMIISALSSASWYCIVMKLGVVPSTYIYPLVKQMLPWKIRMFLGKDDQTWLILKRPLYIYMSSYLKFYTTTNISWIFLVLCISVLKHRGICLFQWLYDLAKLTTSIFKIQSSVQSDLDIPFFCGVEEGNPSGQCEWMNWPWFSKELVSFTQ